MADPAVLPRPAAPAAAVTASPAANAELASISLEPPAVSARGLTLDFGRQRVLDAVSFDVPRGAVLGVVGRNGAGKTTLLNCLLGLTVPDAGESRLLGCASLALDDRVKAQLGVVAQAPELFDWLSVREQVALLGPLYPDWSPERAEALVRRFELPDGRVGKLSPGEKQRVAIVLALMHRPQLLVFDEPVASLDPVSRRDFLRALIELDAADGDAPTVIISSHLLEDLERVATHLLFMQQGRVQLLGTREELAEEVVAVEGAAPLTGPGVLHTRAVDGGWQSIVDLRVAPAVVSGTVLPLSLGELFVALNA